MKADNSSVTFKELHQYRSLFIVSDQNKHFLQELFLFCESLFYIYMMCMFPTVLAWLLKSLKYN